MASLETPEQVRERMAQRLDELKATRKQEQAAHVGQAVDRKFKMETDELRQEETKFMIAGCQLEREKQLMDKRSKLEQAIQEENVYAKLWMLDHDKKHQREIDEAVEKAANLAKFDGVELPSAQRLIGGGAIDNLSVRELHYIKMGLDEVMGLGKRGASKTSIGRGMERGLKNARASFIDIIDNASPKVLNDAGDEVGGHRGTLRLEELGMVERADRNAEEQLAKRRIDAA